MLTQEESIKLTLNMSLKVLKKYEWLLNLYVLDFFVDNHWNMLPTCWQECFQNMDPKDLGEVLCGKTGNRVLPLAFLCLLKVVNCYSLPRENNLRNEKKENKDHFKLRNLFLKHVKLKKRHEISVMSEFVSSTAKLSKCNRIIDFGSGLGHLVRILAYKYNLYAVGIEAQTQLTEQASKLDLEYEYTAKKHVSVINVPKFLRPTHHNVTLKHPNQLKEIALNKSADGYGLVGLHPCGDLGPFLIQHFVVCNEVKFICVVGCCYMKLSCDKEFCGYPMSQFVKNLDSKLSYTTKEIACHAIEMYIERLCAGNYEDLKVHAYRAALEKILIEMDSKLQHMPIRSVKHTNNLSFEGYCTKALEHLCLPSTPSYTGVDECLMRWKQVVVLYTLRLALAPLIETVILLDRMLYIIEHGLECEIQPAFDPRISPRNHILIGRRK